MNIEIVWEGRSLSSHERAWVEDYIARSKKYARVGLTRIKDFKKEKTPKKNHFCVALDEKGKSYSTQQWAKMFSKAQQTHKGNLQFLIGGAYGLPDQTKSSAHSLISLSPLTLPHRLALLIVAEQVYRVLSFQAGDPYHHA